MRCQNAGRRSRISAARRANCSGTLRACSSLRTRARHSNALLRCIRERLLGGAAASRALPAFARGVAPKLPRVTTAC
jgi:hypothetical protein